MLIELIQKVDKLKDIARLAPDSDYKEGYLKAMTNITAILDEYLNKHGF